METFCKQVTIRCCYLDQWRFMIPNETVESLTILALWTLWSPVAGERSLSSCFSLLSSAPSRTDCSPAEAQSPCNSPSRGYGDARHCPAVPSSSFYSSRPSLEPSFSQSKFKLSFLPIGLPLVQSPGCQCRLRFPGSNGRRLRQVFLQSIFTLQIDRILNFCWDWFGWFEFLL